MSPAFVGFLERDSRQLDATHVDVSASLDRVKEQAASLREPEIRFTRELVANSAAPANMRILGAFVLMNGMPRTLSALYETAKGIPIVSERAEPHSLAEIKNVQNKSLVLMAVDAIADRAATDPAARDYLLRLAKEVRDSTIIRHIEERIRALPAL